MINLMNKRALIASLAIAASAIAMTALAQVDMASTTPPTDVATTTTDQVITPEASTTPATEPEATTSTPTSTTTPEAPTTSTVQVPATPTPQALPNAIAPSSSVFDVKAVTALEDSYFAKVHRYIQIVPGNKLPDYETGTVAQRLGADMPAGARVDVYESPKGFGYQIIYDENGTTYSVGFGPEAEDRTYSRPIPAAAVASSTSETLPTI